MVVQVKTQHGGGGVCGNVKPVHVDRVNGEQVAVGSSVTVAGMLNAAQCQNPLAVGASGSNMVTAMDLVPSGRPDQASWGDTFAGATYVSGMASPHPKSVEVRGKSGRSRRDA